MSRTIIISNRLPTKVQRAQPDKELLTLLADLGADPHNRVVVISRRDRAELDQWFGHLPPDLVAEHGVWLRCAGEGWHLLQEIQATWKREFRPLLEQYVRRTAGLHKGTAVARWLASEHPDFILALGNDRTGEDTFAALPPVAYTVRVGRAPRSLVRYSVPSPTEVRQLLRRLLSIAVNV